MSKTTRLLQLMQLLRRQKQPISAEKLATHMKVSIRTLYRDIDTLREQGADIRGEAGVGYLLVQDSGLPPLMFNQDELEALIFGMRLASTQGDDALVQGAKSALGKLLAVLPDDLKQRADAQVLYPAYRRHYDDDEKNTLVLLRLALAQGLSVHFNYMSLADVPSERTVLPVAVGYFTDCCLLAAFCLLRQDFRHFRIESISQMRLDAPCPIPHDWLLKRWQDAEGCIDFSPFDLSLNAADTD